MRIGTNPSRASFAWVRRMFCGDCGRVPGGCPGSRVGGPRPRDRTPSRTRPHVWCHTRVTRHVRGPSAPVSADTAYTRRTRVGRFKWGVRSRGNGRGSVGSRPVFTVCFKPVRAREAVFRAVLTLHYENLTISPAARVSGLTRDTSPLRSGGRRPAYRPSGPVRRAPSVRSTRLGGGWACAIRG